MKVIVFSTKITSFDTDLIDRLYVDYTSSSTHSYTIINPNTYSNLINLVQHFIDLLHQNELVIAFDETSKQHMSYIESYFKYVNVIYLFKNKTA